MFIKVSPAQVGVIVACLEIEGPEYMSSPEVEELCQSLKDSVCDFLGDDMFYDMWLQEFDIIP